MPAHADDSALRIALCEDAAVDTDLLTALIDMSKIPYRLDAFTSGEALLEVFTKEKYDLIFLDVYMAELTGVQTAERIRDIDTQVVIVFTTTSDDFTREGYRLNAYKYLLKPVVEEDVVDALELATLKRDKAQGATLAIVTDNVPVVIPLNDIIFVESSNRRSLIYTTGETYATTLTIDALEKLLPSPRFLRSHRSYIVNLDHVEDLEEDFIMDNGDIAYVAVKNHRKIKHAYDDYLFSTVRGDE
ncbi:MAG: LytTR family DNA-binding domain-containing protein [Coriobacteriales bacterium]|jgi:DNA-binding LytR/AlgR family response regulator|nr:LytTR family DNA-binding domain-containing protein [Coriobacteriales bacterium]